MSRTETIEKIFGFVQEDIGIRIESLRLNLDLECESFNAKLRRLKRKLIKRNRFDSALFVRLLSKPFQHMFYDKNKHFPSLDLFKSETSGILQSYLLKTGLNSLSSNLVGRVNSFGINLKHLEYIEPKRINPPDVFMTAMCALNDKILIADQKHNKILICDKHLNIIQTIFEIDKVLLKGPCSICTDSNDTVFICDKLNSHIIATEKNFKKIKTIFQDQRIKLPIWIEYFKKSIYVLNEKTRCIQEYRTNGQFVQRIDIFTFQETTEINKFHMFATKIAILSVKNGIYIVDIRGNYLYGLNSNRYQNIYKTNDDYLIMVTMSGVLNFYDLKGLTLSSVFDRSFKDHAAALLNVACIDNFLYLYYRWSDVIDFDSHFMIFEC